MKELLSSLICNSMMHEKEHADERKPNRSNLNRSFYPEHWWNK